MCVVSYTSANPWTIKPMNKPPVTLPEGLTTLEDVLSCLKSFEAVCRELGRSEALLGVIQNLGLPLTNEAGVGIEKAQQAYDIARDLLLKTIQSFAEANIKVIPVEMQNN